MKVRGRGLRHLSRKALMFRCAMVAVVLGIFGFAAFFISTRLVQTVPEPKGDLQARVTKEEPVEFSGKKYEKKDDLTTLLLIGVDHITSGTGALANFRNGGQADFLLLLVLNRMDQTITPVEIDRDTMTNIRVLGVLGGDAGTKYEQICLAHSFGDGDAQSCGFVVQALEDLLQYVEVDAYLAMDTDAIGTLNDALGGVPVTIQDDLTHLDEAMYPGAQMVLTGKQAEIFVRSRMSVSDGTNRSRMNRQNEYLKQAANVLTDRVKADVMFAQELYETLKDDLVTNMSQGRMLRMLNRCVQYSRLETQQIPGEYAKGTDGFVEFHADALGLGELVMRVFYEEIG